MDNATPFPATAGRAHIVSTSYDATVRLWELTSGFQLMPIGNHKLLIDGLAISHDGQYIATGSMDKSVRIWKRNNLELLAEIVDFDSGVKTVRFSPNSYFLVAATEECLWYPINILNLLASDKHKVKYKAKDLLKKCPTSTH